MQISRRDALMGATAAAVVTGAATAPLAIKAALGGEPDVAVTAHELQLIFERIEARLGCCA